MGQHSHSSTEAHLKYVLLQLLRTTEYMLLRTCSTRDAAEVLTCKSADGQKVSLFILFALPSPSDSTLYVSFGSLSFEPFENMFCWRRPTSLLSYDKFTLAGKTEKFRMLFSLNGT